MLRGGFAGAALLGLAFASLPLAATAAMSMNSGDSTFVIKAGQAGMAEVALAALALEKSSNPHVISFAKEMHADHSKANAQLMSILQDQGVKPPSGVGAKNAAPMTELKAQSGSAFDSHYLKSQLPAHQQLLPLFQAEAANGLTEAGRDVDVGEARLGHYGAACSAAASQSSRATTLQSSLSSSRLSVISA